jgi:Zn-dependent protease
MFDSFFIMGPINLLMRIPSIIIVVTLHEYIKALVSTRLGDPVPKDKGRLTLNPLKHMDPFGAICLFLTGYGWGKPVQTSPIHYRDKEKGTLITYVMPSLANLFFGSMFAVAYGVFWQFAMTAQNSENITEVAYYALECGRWLLYYMAFHNIAMAFYNIIPVFPLDGYKILNLFLPPLTIVKLQQFETILQFLLLGATLMGWVGILYDPAVEMIMNGLQLIFY